MRWLLLISLLFGLFGKLEAHGDLHERIVKVSEEISKDPLNPELYFKRGQLYFYHEDFNLALADYQKAKSLGLASDDVAYWEARLYLQTEQTSKGINTINQYLAAHPTDVNALRVYGKLAEQAKDWPTAIEQFELVITHTTTPLPDNYMELVYALKQTNNYDGALKWLSNGVEKLGRLFVFDAERVAIYKAQDNYPKAIEVYTYWALSSNRKESYYYEIANCYKHLGDKENARTFYELSLSAIQRLSQHLQDTAAMKELAANIKTAYEDL